MMASLPALIRKRIDERTLPREDPVKVFAGYGRGARCSVCDDVIGPAQVEADFVSDGRELRFHSGCFGLWEAECRRRGWRHRSESAA